MSPHLLCKRLHYTLHTQCELDSHQRVCFSVNQIQTISYDQLYDSHSSDANQQMTYYDWSILSIPSTSIGLIQYMMWFVACGFFASTIVPYHTMQAIWFSIRSWCNLFLDICLYFGETDFFSSDHYCIRYLFGFLKNLICQILVVTTRNIMTFTLQFLTAAYCTMKVRCLRGWVKNL